MAAGSNTSLATATMIRVMEQLKREFATQPLHPGLEALEDGFCMLDAQWRVTYWNGAAERMLSLPRHRVLGKEATAVLPFLRNHGNREHLERALAGQATSHFLEPLGDHHRGYTSVRVTPVSDGGLAVHFRDCTEEVKRAERYVDLLESIRDGFIAVDNEWKITYLNSVAESLFRLSRDQGVGLSIWSLLPRDPGEVQQALRATMEDGMLRHLQRVRPSGRVFRGRVFDLWVHSLAGGGVSIFIEDVTEQFQREQELARLAAEAEEVNRAKSRFFAAVSHELRTPLNAIVGYTHLLSSETYGSIPDPARRAAERAEVCAEHLARLVDDVLLLTGSEIQRLPVSPAPVRLQEFLGSVVTPIQLQARAKGLNFELDIPGDLPVLETDPQRLRQLLLALLSNAVKFTNRGTVALSARIAQRPIMLTQNGSLAAEDAALEIMVADTGPGIPHQDRERIFGIFEQLGDPARSESMTRGPGIGLTVARQLAQLLGGELRLADTSPAGSRFSLLLPFEPPGRSNLS